MLCFSDVAFEVGDDATKYLVLQVHYGHVDKFKSKLIIILYHVMIMVRGRSNKGTLGEVKEKEGKLAGWNG